MADGLLSFSASEQFRKRLIVSNLEPYYVKGSGTQIIPKIKHTQKKQDGLMYRW